MYDRHKDHQVGCRVPQVRQSIFGSDESKPWRNTFLIGPEQTTEIAFVADNPGKWHYHCHMLENVATGMNTWFTVV
tara:strand:+ start:5295 stop:5522 length:228 start_codon:yes stop_codon:yes gene_type:complete